MDIRIGQANTAQRVMKAITDAGATAESVSKATGIPMSVLNGVSPFTVTDLANAGGFLHFHPAYLIGEAA